MIHSTPTGEAMTVLVVEDEQRLCDMLCDAIGRMGYRTACARTAEHALRHLETAPAPAEIAVIDLNLPQMNGLDLFERVRGRWPKIQVVILTGFGDLEAAQRAIRLNVVDFLTKPCALGDLETALSRARQRHQSAQPPAEVTEPRDPVFPEEAITPPATLEQLEHRHILTVLEKHNGNRALTARELGISERTLYYRLARYQKNDPTRP